MRRGKAWRLAITGISIFTCTTYTLVILTNNSRELQSYDVLTVDSTSFQETNLNLEGTSNSSFNTSTNLTSKKVVRKDQPVKGPVPVIIMTYMRSGSSFLGEILQAPPTTLYWFEPVHEIWGKYKENKNRLYDFQDGSARVFPSFPDIAVPTITDICTCDIEKLPMQALREQFIGKSKQMKELVKCRGYVEKGHVSNSNLLKCVPNVKRKCSNARHVVVKTIRMTMKSMESMLEKIPNLKIIHLMRDPRGTSRSQQAVGQLSKKHYKDEIADYCKQVYQDLLQKDEFDKIYPDRILTVFYEDIAKKPIEYAKFLYKQLGMEFTKETENVIKQLTESGKTPRRCGILCTQMANSSKEAYAWRNEIRLDLVKYVDKSCSDVYNKIGYVPIPDIKALRDPSFVLRRER